METPLGGMWNQTFSVAGLNTSVSQDGLRRKSTRTATAVLWPRTAENASAVPFVFFISTHVYAVLVTCIDLGTRVVPSACGAILLRHLEVRGSRHIGFAPLTTGFHKQVGRGLAPEGGGRACSRHAKGRC